MLPPIAFLFTYKMHRNVFVARASPRTTQGTYNNYSTPPDPLLDYRGPLNSRQEEGKREREE